MTTTTIRTEGLTRKFGRTVALDHLDIAVPEGAIYALVGANGAGKTTAIKLLMNILHPTAGSAQVLGLDSRHLAGKSLARIGYVSENQELPESMTVGAMLGYLRGFYPSWDRALEEHLVRRFDLPLQRKIRHLSRGMKIKAAFAASLAYHPALIVLDEPFSGLDPLVRDELVESLLDHAQETTVFVSSHDLDEIENVSSHVGFLENGRLLFSEESAALNGRFREVTATLDSPAPLPGNLPAAWLEPYTSGHALKFVDSNFDEQRTRRELAERFPSAHDPGFEPMSLRSIFLTIARAHRARRTSRTQENEA